jgi:hypothetical protein
MCGLAWLSQAVFWRMSLFSYLSRGLYSFLSFRVPNRRKYSVTFALGLRAYAALPLISQGCSDPS